MTEYDIRATETVTMKPGEILRAARLLKQREELRRLHALLKQTDGMEMGLYGAQGDEMANEAKVDNITGQLTIEHAIWVINTELERLKVEL